MSKMAELDYEIQELFIDGHSARGIAKLLDCPIEQVLVTLETFGVQEKITHTPELDDISSSYYGA